MGFNLHLILRGLCAVVPGGQVPADPPALPHPVDDLKVLVLSAKAGTVGNLLICEHVAQLQAEQLQGPDRVVPLVGHTIEVGPLPAGEQLKLNSTFWDVAHMNRVYKDFAVAPGLLDNPAERPDLFVGSLRLPAGGVSGFDFSPEVLSFQSTDYSGNFARAMRIRVPIDGESGTLTLTPYEGGEPITVDIAPRPGEDFVEATLSNLCTPPPAAMDLAGMDLASMDLAAAAPPQRDFDYAVYYRLEQTIRKDVRVPLVASGVPLVDEVVALATEPGGSCIPTRIGGN